VVALGQQSTTEESALTYAVDPRIAAQLLLAWDLWILGYPDQALHNVLQAQLRAKQRGEPYTTAFAYYVTSAVQLLRGEAQASLASAEQSLALKATAEAEQNYISAINVARRQSARSLELRAATSLARLLRAQGRSNEVRSRLAPLLAWFTEGLDTADVKDAKALLEGLQYEV
jgi:predicted ATPase